MKIVGEMIDRIWSAFRFGRKPKPVTYLDIEVRDVDGFMRTAYRVGDGPVVVSPWYSASCQKGS